jgi:hypothetical protein
MKKAVSAPVFIPRATTPDPMQHKKCSNVACTRVDCSSNYLSHGVFQYPLAIDSGGIISSSIDPNPCLRQYETRICKDMNTITQEMNVVMGKFKKENESQPDHISWICPDVPHKCGGIIGTKCGNISYKINVVENEGNDAYSVIKHEDESVSINIFTVDISRVRELPRVLTTIYGYSNKISVQYASLITENYIREINQLRAMISGDDLNVGKAPVEFESMMMKHQMINVISILTMHTIAKNLMSRVGYKINGESCDKYKWRISQLVNGHMPLDTSQFVIDYIVNYIYTANNITDDRISQSAEDIYDSSIVFD